MPTNSFDCSSPLALALVMHVLNSTRTLSFNRSRTQWVPAILQAGSLEHFACSSNSPLTRAGFELALVQCQPKLTPVEQSTPISGSRPSKPTTYLPKATVPNVREVKQSKEHWQAIVLCLAGFRLGLTGPRRCWGALGVIVWVVSASE